MVPLRWHVCKVTDTHSLLCSVTSSDWVSYPPSLTSSKSRSRKKILNPVRFNDYVRRESSSEFEDIVFAPTTQTSSTSATWGSCLQAECMCNSIYATTSTAEKLWWLDICKWQSFEYPESILDILMLNASSQFSYWSWIYLNSTNLKQLF